MPSATLTEYAERVLFSTTLEEKLTILNRTEVNLQESPARKISMPDVPTRPQELRFAKKEETAGRSELPARAALVNDQSRGQLLHFFANHELLAAELMAFAILKFPDAPAAFRSGLFETLREEQMHTRWYIKRMKECGVTFGEFSLNRFFWDAVATMETPLDYVSRLSLTFEQANLDYSRHFAGILNEAGDQRSAQILEQIYKDEIEHVGYGLNWFRKWKNPAESDWEALQGALHFPLSPSRAKAGGSASFNEEGRRKAGFDLDFIQNLELFERSKGRTPNVFFFNPEAEDQISSWIAGENYEASPKVSSLIKDLEILTVFLARRDDVVLLEKLPSNTHLKMLSDAGVTLPEFEHLDANRQLPPSALLFERRIRELRPWAHCPFAAKTLGELTGEEIWNPKLSDLFSKAKQSERLAEWMELPNTGGPVVKKPSISSAGRGNRILKFEPKESPLTDSHPSHSEVIEPWVDRVFDYSVQFEYDGATLKNLGVVRQLIGNSGQYRGSFWQPKFLSGVEPDVSRLMATVVMPHYKPDSKLCRELTRWFDECGFRGAFGIDGFIYKMSDGSLRGRTVCEINPRYTMGRVALELSRLVAPGRTVLFSIGKADPSETSNFQLSDSGKLESGRMFLNEISESTVFTAKLEVE